MSIIFHYLHAKYYVLSLNVEYYHCVIMVGDKSTKVSGYVKYGGHGEAKRIDLATHCHVNLALS